MAASAVASSRVWVSVADDLQQAEPHVLQHLAVWGPSLAGQSADCHAQPGAACVLDQTALQTADPQHNSHLSVG